MADVKPLDITCNSDEPPPGLSKIDQRNNRKTAAFRSFLLSQVKRRLVTQCTRTCTTSRSGRRTRSSAPGLPWRKWTGRMAAWSSCREPTPEPCRSMTTPNGRYKPNNFFKKCNFTRHLGTHLNIMPCVFRVAWTRCTTECVAMTRSTLGCTWRWRRATLFSFTLFWSMALVWTGPRASARCSYTHNPLGVQRFPQGWHLSMCVCVSRPSPATTRVPTAFTSTWREPCRKILRKKLPRS